MVLMSLSAVAVMASTSLLMRGVHGRIEDLGERKQALDVRAGLVVLPGADYLTAHVHARRLTYTRAARSSGDMLASWRSLRMREPASMPVAPLVPFRCDPYGSDHAMSRRIVPSIGPVTVCRATRVACQESLT